MINNDGATIDSLIKDYILPEFYGSHLNGDAADKIENVYTEIYCDYMRDVPTPVHYEQLLIDDNHYKII